MATVNLYIGGVRAFMFGAGVVLMLMAVRQRSTERKQWNYVPASGGIHSQNTAECRSTHSVQF